MCKARIEKASLKVKGVKYVNWDIPSKQLTLILDENKCSPLDVKRLLQRLVTIPIRLKQMIIPIMIYLPAVNIEIRLV